MNHKNNSLIRDIERVLSANFIVAFVGFLGAFVFPKILSIDSYAFYHTFTLYVGYTSICSLGFPSGMMINYAGKDYSNIDEKQYKSEVLILFIIYALFTATLLLVARLLNNRVVAYVGITILPLGIIGAYKSLLQAWGRFKYFSRLSSINAVSIPVLALTFYFVNHGLSGDEYVWIYIIVNWIIFFYIFHEIITKIRGIKANPIITKRNWETEKTGAAVLVGNYINTLFTSADKQFVSWFFSTTQFAFYSFGMSMQSLMTVFITSIAQPLFPAMARGQFKDEEYDRLKEVLMIFGSFSACAYFAASFIVKHFIQKYIPSIEVIGIYFVVFPVMAVINCLFVNLYKIKNLMRQYVITLAVILGIAIGLNALFVAIYPAYYGVAIATVITYYIWFFIGIRQFKFIHLRVIDLLYLGIYTVGFFLITEISNDIIGFFVALAFNVILAAIFYRKDFNYVLRMVKRKI